MEQVKAGASTDEFGDSLNNVETVLTKVNIKLRDTADSFRPLGDVIDEVASKWSTFSDVQKNQIATAIAGVRQGQVFLTLMQNYGDVQKYVTAETDSAGLAQNRYQIYLQGVEAAQNKLTATWEKFWMTTVQSGNISWFLNLGSTILDVASNAGGLVPIIILLVGAFIALKGTYIDGFFLGLINNISSTITALISLDAAAITSSVVINSAFGVIGIVIAAASVAYMLWGNQVEKAQQHVQELASAVGDLRTKIDQLNEQRKSLNDLSTSFEDLKNKANKSNQEQKDFLDVQNKIHDILPEVAGSYDEQGNFILDASVNLNTLIELKNKELEINQKLLDQKMSEEFDAQAKVYQQQADALKNLINEKNAPQQAAGKGGGKLYAVTSQDIADQKTLSDQALNDLKITYNSMTEAGKEAKKESLRLEGETGQAMLTQILSVSGEILSRSQIVALQYAKDVGAQVAQATYTSFKDTLDSLSKSSSLVDSLVSKQNKGQVGMGELAQAVDTYGVEALQNENGVLKINIDLIKQKQLAEAKEAVQAAEDAGASEQEVAALQTVYEELNAQSQTTFGQFHQTAYDYDALLWSIANDAEAAGFQFEDMQGKALTSAQNIFDYMSMGDAQFNAVVVQIAQQTGRSVQEVTNAIQGMISAAISNVTAAMNYARLLVEYGKSASINATMGSQGFTMSSIGWSAAPTTNLFSGYTAPNYGGSKKDQAAADAAAKQKQIEQDIADARTKATDALNNQLKIYQNIIDVRKKLLDSMQTERSYQEDLATKTKNQETIQNQILALQFDTSDAAKAQRLELEDELAKAKQDLGDLQYSHSIDAQKAALDADYTAFETRINSALDAVKAISAGSLSSFSRQLADILASIGNAPQFHSGAEMGVVGNSNSLRSGEIFARLLKGEVVSTPQQMENFMKISLPQLVESSSNVNNGTMKIEKLINVEGNVNPVSMPDLENVADKVVEQLNKNMKIRGWNRRADLFSNG